jgi:hypothetical protein
MSRQDRFFAEPFAEERAAKRKGLGARWETTKMKANLFRRSVRGNCQGRQFPEKEN